MPDPLVAEIAERAVGVAPGAAALHDADAALPLHEPCGEDDAAELHELAELDAELHGLLHPAPARRRGSAPPHNENAPGRRVVRDLMLGVGFPTARSLASASLAPLRAAMERLSEERDAYRWGAYQIFLGTALKVRAQRVRGHERANLLIEATRALDAAYGVYAPLYAVAHSDCRVAGRLSGVANAPEGERQQRHRSYGYRPYGLCVGERDSTLLIARAISGAAWERSDLLERAVINLRLVRASANVESWIWVSSTNNLACALTLLARRTPPPACAAMLREAARVLCELLKRRSESLRSEDRASTLINLAEALLSMAESETPHLRMAKIERAFAASAAALLSVVPPELAWIVCLEPMEVA